MSIPRNGTEKSLGFKFGVQKGWRRIGMALDLLHIDGFA